MFFGLRIWWDAIILTVLESWDRYQVSKKMKYDHQRNLTLMLDMID